jgi:hypothetical protein
LFFNIENNPKDSNCNAPLLECDQIVLDSTQSVVFFQHSSTRNRQYLTNLKKNGHFGFEMLFLLVYKIPASPDSIDDGDEEDDSVSAHVVVDRPGNERTEVRTSLSESRRACSATPGGGTRDLAASSVLPAAKPRRRDDLSHESLPKLGVGKLSDGRIRRRPKRLAVTFSRITAVMFSRITAEIGRRQAVSRSDQT